MAVYHDHKATDQTSINNVNLVNLNSYLTSLNVCLYLSFVRSLLKPNLK